MKKRGFYLIILLMIAVTLLSSCGNKEEESGVSTYETRSTVEAIQGKDYRIDDIIVAIADSPNQNGDVQYISYDELKVLLQTKKEKGESIHCRVTIKYTALNELSGTKGGLSLNFWSFEGGQSIVQ